jgi:hypothetical protein
MMLGMKERVTISVEPEALEIARADVAAGRAPSVSAAVEMALVERQRLQEFDELLAMFDRHHADQPLTAEELHRGEAELTQKSWVEEG